MLKFKFKINTCLALVAKDLSILLGSQYGGTLEGSKAFSGCTGTEGTGGRKCLESWLYFA